MVATVCTVRPRMHCWDAAFHVNAWQVSSEIHPKAHSVRELFSRCVPSWCAKPRPDLCGSKRPTRDLSLCQLHHWHSMKLIPVNVRSSYKICNRDVGGCIDFSAYALMFDTRHGVLECGFHLCNYWCHYWTMIEARVQGNTQKITSYNVGFLWYDVHFRVPFHNLRE